MADERPHADPALVAAYLRGLRIGLRAPSIDDADSVAAWDDSPLPRTPDAGREMLRRSEQTPWGNAEHVRLMVVDLASGTVHGSVMVERQHDRIGKCRIISSPMLALDRRDEIEGDALDLVIPWLRDELDLMVIVLDVAADRAGVIARAGEHGLREVVRLREHIRRRHGWIDLVTLELVNPAWRHALAGGDGVSHA